MQQMEIVMPTINPEIFDKEKGKFSLGEETYTFLIETNADGKPKIEYVKGRGTLTYYKGILYPVKGAQTPEAMYALNQMKRLLLETVKLCRNPLILLGMYFSRKKAMASFLTMAEKIMSEHSIKAEYMCRGAYAVEVFLIQIVGNEKFAHFIAQIPEYDDAYRYRMQDMFTALEVEDFIANPRKETRRLIALWESREGIWSKGVFIKLKPLFKLLELAMYIPSIRKKVTENIRILKIGVFDEDDKYWVCVTDNGYHYFGVPSEERLKLYSIRPEGIKITI